MRWRRGKSDGYDCTQGNKNAEKLHLTRYCSKLQSSAKHRNLQSYASLYSGDLYKSKGGVQGAETFCLVSLSHHAQLCQANQDEKFKPSAISQGVRFGPVMVEF